MFSFGAVEGQGMGGMRYGREELALARLAFTTADELLAMALKLERRLRQKGHTAIAVSIGNFAADTLAQIAAANQAMTGDYFSRLEARRLLGGARKSLNEFTRWVGTAGARAGMDSEFEKQVLARAEETQALVMALNLAVRGVRVPETRKQELPPTG